jgi:hypothetical protein
VRSSQLDTSSSQIISGTKTSSNEKTAGNDDVIIGRDISGGSDVTVGAPNDVAVGCSIVVIVGWDIVSCGSSRWSFLMRKNLGAIIDEGVMIGSGDDVVKHFFRHH